MKTYFVAVDKRRNGKSEVQLWGKTKTPINPCEFDMSSDVKKGYKTLAIAKRSFAEWEKFSRMHSGLYYDDICVRLVEADGDIGVISRV